MPLTQLAPPYPIFTDKSGSPLDNGYLYFGTVNLNPETNPITVYYDAALTQPAAQPLRTSNGYVMRNGSPAIIYANTYFSVTVRDKNRAMVIYSPIGYGIIPGTSATSTDQMTYTQGGTGSAARVLTSRLQDYVSVKDFGAKGDGVTNDTTAIQNAVNATPVDGQLYFPAGKYIISSAITINKPMKILGSNAGSIYNSNGSYIQQVTPTENAFTLVARTANYAFGQYGIVGVTFDSISIHGNSDATRSLNGIGVDTTVNGGDFHIRECVFKDVNIKWFAKAYDLKGIAYLNDWFNGSIINCTKGVVITKGAASDNGGQTRFFGLTAVLNTGACVELNLDATSGDFAFFGCTLSESGFGIKCNEEAVLAVYGCQFESNVSGGVGAGIYIEVKEANPNTTATKVVNGCKFLTNDADIWIDKTTSAFVGGDFYWPMTIDGCILLSTNGLKITVPAGHSGMMSKAFVLGTSNSGSNNSKVADSQISANFLGSDLREYPFNTLKDFSYNFQQISFNGTGAPNQYLASLNVPNGSTLYLKNLARYSFNTTTGVRGNAGFAVVDGGGTTRLNLFGSGYTASASWTNSTGGALEVVIYANDGGSGNPYLAACRAYVI